MAVLQTRVFYADELEPLAEQVNTFLATLVKSQVKDVQYTPGKTWQVGSNQVFGAWVVYEV